MIDLFDETTMEPLFYFLERCESVEQMLNHHPEGNVFNHSLQVLQHAFRETTDVDLILAAMLHDVGKYESSKGHEQKAVVLLNNLVSKKTLWLIEQHMRIWELILGKMKRKMKVQYLIDHPYLKDLLLLARWDKMGRVPNKKVPYSRSKIIDRLNKCVEDKYANL
jgi:predicted HD phosphohydrolase